MEVIQYIRIQRALAVGVSVHSIGQVKLRGNEVLVEGLSQQLVGFIRDNKDLIRIIMDEKEQKYV